MPRLETPDRDGPGSTEEATGRGYWESVGRDWSEGRPQALWRRHSDAVNARLLEAWLPPGCTGTLLKTDAFDEAVAIGLGALLRTRCQHLVAMDVAVGTLRAAQTRLGERLVVADARALPFASDSLDRVVSLSTLDHFESEAELLGSLAELRRVCAPGACVVLTLDNPSNPLVRLRGALPSAWLQRLGVVPYFVCANLDPVRLRCAIEASGFVVEASTATLHVPRILAVWLGRGIEALGSRWLARRWLALLMRFEGLARWPTRALTGHFVAIRARVPETPAAPPQPASRC